MRKNISIIQKRFSVVLLAAVVFLSGCNSSKRVLYMQDITEEVRVPIENFSEPILRPNDKVSIFVSSKEASAAAVYNLRGHEQSATATNMYQGPTYPIDQEGNINFPVLGKIRAAGLTRMQLEKTITDLLRNGGHLKDAVVMVQLQNFHIAVLGEVARPNKFNIDNERVTLLDAIAMAGDLTIYGRRDSVLVVRESPTGEREYLYCNLLSSDFTNSPAFYLRQNDVVYVKPNSKRSQGSEQQNDNIRLIISIASFLTTLGVIIFR